MELQDKKFNALVHALEDISDDIGMYPAAVSGCPDPTKNYMQRNEFHNGWNAAVIAIIDAVDNAVQKARAGLHDDLLMLLAADVGWLKPDGTFVINFNDTWAWACADGEAVTPDELPTVARLYRRWGFAGLLYWCTTKRPGLRSEFKDNNRFIDFVAREEALIAAVPNSSKRAYMDLPEEHNRVAALEAVLLSMKHADHCWCQKSIGNPMMTTHSEACLAAQALLKVPEEM